MDGRRTGRGGRKRRETNTIGWSAGIQRAGVFRLCQRLAADGLVFALGGPRRARPIHPLALDSRGGRGPKPKATATDSVPRLPRSIGQHAGRAPITSPGDVWPEHRSDWLARHFPNLSRLWNGNAAEISPPRGSRPGRHPYLVSVTDTGSRSGKSRRHRMFDRSTLPPRTSRRLAMDQPRTSMRDRTVSPLRADSLGHSRASDRRLDQRNCPSTRRPTTRSTTSAGPVGRRRNRKFELARDSHCAADRAHNRRREFLRPPPLDRPCLAHAADYSAGDTAGHESRLRAALNRPPPATNRAQAAQAPERGPRGGRSRPRRRQFPRARHRRLPRCPRQHGPRAPHRLAAPQPRADATGSGRSADRRDGIWPGDLRLAAADGPSSAAPAVS